MKKRNTDIKLKGYIKERASLTLRVTSVLDSKKWVEENLFRSQKNYRYLTNFFLGTLTVIID